MRRCAKTAFTCTCTVHVAWIMAEIELYSFASTQDSSESEEDDVHEHKDEC